MYFSPGNLIGTSIFGIFHRQHNIQIYAYTENKRIIHHAKKHLYSSDANSIEAQLDNSGVSAIGDDQSASGSLMSSP